MTPAPPPRTWLLMGHKAGDNAQLLALAEATGFPYETRRLVYRPTELLSNRLLGPNLLGIVRERSDPLVPPWPELVLTAGRRNEPVARWIKEQAGGKTKLVQMGRPWARLELFDLIVTTPQYNLPDLPNVLHNEAPLHRITPERLAVERERWALKLAHLPRPYVAVILGGHSGPYSFDAEAGARLGREASRMAHELGGSLLVTTSARTPADALAAFERELAAPHAIHLWRLGDAENPYVGYLALAERIVLTCESMSMLIEAIATGKPVLVFGLPKPVIGRRLQPLWYWLGQHVGPRQLRREVGRIHEAQIKAGRAAWLGDPLPDPTRAPPLADTARAAARVRALFAA